MTSSALAAPPAGKGKNKNIAITLFDESEISCDGAPVAVGAATTIAVGSEDPQCYKYSITLPSNSPAGAQVLEELTSTFNLDPDAEDAASGTAEEEADDNGLEIVESEPGEGQCADTDPDCDGVDFVLDGKVDGVDMGADSACTAYTSRPDSHVKLNDGNIPAHQAELIVISVDTGDTGCTATFYAITDGAQEGAIFDSEGVITGYNLFLPSKCTPLRQHTRYDTDGNSEADTENKLTGIVDDGGDPLRPFVEYVALNRGTRAFRPNRSLITSGNSRNGVGGVAVFRSIQLQPLGCDTDGDLDPNESDPAPLDPDVFTEE